MGTARIAILALAALAAGFAAFLVQSVLRNKPEAAVAQKGPNYSVTEVLVAARDLGLGQQITAADVRWQAWPEGAITAAYLVKSQAEAAMQLAVGATVRQTMLAGEPVTQQKVVRSENAGFMAAMLSPGMRAVSVSISVETGAGGFILPNDRVDVILTERGQAKGGNEQHDSRIFLSNVRILAIDQTYREEGDKQVVIGKTATLELSPTQSESLARAAATGTVSLALRSLSDGNKDKKTTETPRDFSGTVTILRYGSSQRVTLNGDAQ